MPLKEIIENELSESIIKIAPLSGGDINEVFKITTQNNTYVLKINSLSIHPKMFVKEKLGLQSISLTGANTPDLIKIFSNSQNQFLILEYIEEESTTKSFWKNFATSLVKLHKTSNKSFGLKYDNYIGSLSQNNAQKRTWEQFFIENRINPLVKQAFDKNLLNKNHLSSFESLFKKLNEILPTEPPSLVHGDLWSGNLLKGKGQTPVFIDPAIYYGNREMDIAMTQMFGGFDKDYINYYNEWFPLESGWQQRIEIHNLYPCLVHLILFGSSYLRGIEKVIKKF